MTPPAPDAGGWPDALLAWFRREARDLPWRRHRSPYTTWVSEVMLQQTTVEAAEPRYREFLSRFPTLRALAEATEDDVVAAWSGLGYYRRARALHRGARAVVERHGGELPRTEAGLRALPGVGPYTSRAILALAFGRPAVPVDGNVARVAARLFGDEGDVGRDAVRRGLGARLEAAQPRRAAAAFAEALIELGALVCRPRGPDCLLCPLRPGCRAHREGRAGELPRRAPPRAAVPVRSVRAVVRRSGRLLLVERDAGQRLLPGFLELPGRWVLDGTPAGEVLDEVLSALGLEVRRVGELAGTARHAITHHRIRAEAWPVEVRGRPRGARFLDVSSVDRRRLTTETRKLLGREAPA